MKTKITTAVALSSAAFLALFSAATLQAQGFTAAPGFSSAELFRLGTSEQISALGASSGGDLFYIATRDVDGFGGEPGVTNLFRRTAAAAYQDEVSLFSYSGEVFGSFVEVSGSTVYFGESALNTIRSINVNGMGAKLIGTVRNNYDLAVVGGALLISAQPTAGSSISRLILSAEGTLQQLDTIVTLQDNSGPLAVSLTGNLLYGATGDSPFGDSPLPENQEGRIFSFSDLSGAIDANPAVTDRTLTLAQGDVLFPRANNQYLSVSADGAIFQADSTPSFSPGGQSEVFRLGPDGLTALMGRSEAGAFFGGISSAGNQLFVSVGSFGSPSAVFVVVPEPTAVCFAILGSGLLLGRRRRRSL